MCKQFKQKGVNVNLDAHITKICPTSRLVMPSPHSQRFTRLNNNAHTFRGTPQTMITFYDHEYESTMIDRKTKITAISND